MFANSLTRFVRWLFIGVVIKCAMCAHLFYESLAFLRYGVSLLLRFEACPVGEVSDLAIGNGGDEAWAVSLRIH